MSATFQKGERLSSFKEIQALMKGGKSFFHYPFKVVYQNVANDGNPNAVIVSVPKRNFKRAVKRNLLKRRIRESYRLNKGLLVAPDGFRTNILFVYISKEIREFSFIEGKLKEILALVSQGKTKAPKDNVQQEKDNS